MAQSKPRSTEDQKKNRFWGEDSRKISPNFQRWKMVWFHFWSIQFFHFHLLRLCAQGFVEICSKLLYVDLHAVVKKKHFGNLGMSNLWNWDGNPRTLWISNSGIQHWWISYTDESRSNLTPREKKNKKCSGGEDLRRKWCIGMQQISPALCFVEWSPKFWDFTCFYLIIAGFPDGPNTRLHNKNTQVHFVSPNSCLTTSALYLFVFALLKTLPSSQLIEMETNMNPFNV